MQLASLEQIKRAIDQLEPSQVAELFEWLERRHGQSLDDRIRLDLDAGHLDKALDRALNEEAAGQVRPL